MIDLSFMEKKPEVENISPKEKKMNELQQLADLARYVGSYTYQYKGDNKYHDGIIAQELLQVPGLKDAVMKGPDGTLTLDTKYLSMAAIGYVAALVRLILDVIPGTSTPKDIAEQEAIEAEKPVDGPTVEEAL